MAKSPYIIQLAKGSHCPKCDKPVRLLCTEDGNLNKPWFYICFACLDVRQVGKGIVLWEEL